MLGFFARLFGGKPATGLTVPPPQAVQKKVQQGIPALYERWEEEHPTGLDANTLINQANELRDFLELFQIHPWVYSAISATATAMASIPYQVLDEKDEEIKDKEICSVLCNPNPHQVWYELMETTGIYLEGAGNCFWEEVKDDKGNVLAIYPLRPDKMRILPHPKTKVAGYIYSPVPGREILYAPSEITHIKYASALDEYWGISPAYAAQNSIILDMYATAYNKQFFGNSAVPEGVLETEGSLSDQTYRRLKLDWMKRHRGVKNAFELAILEEGLKYKPIGFNQRDMMMVEMKEMSREDVLSAYRVPPVMVGLLKHAQYSSAREQRKMFYMDNVLPKLEKLRQIINKNVMPGKFKIKFRIDDIHTIIEDIQISTQISMSMVSHGIMTINEVRRKFFGLGPVPWGNTPWMPTGLAQWSENPQENVHPQHPQQQAGGSSSTTQAINESTPMGGSMPHEDGKENKDLNKKTVDFEKIAPPEPDWNNPQAVRDWRVWSFWKGTATPDYIELRNLYKKFFNEQFDRMIGKIKSKFPDPKPDKVRKSHVTKLIEETYAEPYLVSKAPVPEDFPGEVENILMSLKWDDEAKKLKTKLVPKAKKIVAKHGKTTLGQLGVTMSFDFNNDRVAEFLEDFGGKHITGINNVTRNKIGKQLAAALQKGEDKEDIEWRISQVLKGEIADSRGRAIARTETITLTQWTKLEAAMQSGVAKKKRWICQLLPTSRNKPGGEDHVGMHGEEVGINEKFVLKSRSGKDEVFGPGDPSASPENNVNCLCILDFPGTVAEFEDLEVLEPVGTRKRN